MLPAKGCSVVVLTSAVLFARFSRKAESRRKRRQISPVRRFRAITTTCRSSVFGLAAGAALSWNDLAAITHIGVRRDLDGPSARRRIASRSASRMSRAIKASCRVDRGTSARGSLSDVPERVVHAPSVRGARCLIDGILAARDTACKNRFPGLALLRSTARR